MFQGDSSHLPLKLNTAGVIPPIFATSLLLLANHNFELSQQQGEATEWLTAFTGVFLVAASRFICCFYAGMIIFFAFFYTFNVSFNPDDVADNLKKQGGFVPGIRPGRKQLNTSTTSLTVSLVLGSLYLTIVCLMPEILLPNSGIELHLAAPRFSLWFP